MGWRNSFIASVSSCSSTDQLIYCEIEWDIEYGMEYIVDITEEIN